MFIRKVKKTNGRTKKRYTYLQLVESIRTDRGPRQKLILNLGDLAVNPSQYKALAKRIEDILTGRMSFLEVDETVEKYAQTAAKKIFRKQANEIDIQNSSDFCSVDINTLQVSAPKQLGPEYVCNSIWNQLGLDEIFIKQSVSRLTLPLIKALVISRLLDPGSEASIKRWVENRSALYELTGIPLRHSLQSYYRGTDIIYSLKNNLEQHLCRTEKDIFSLTETMFFIDLTNTYFEGKGMRNPKAKYGKSKEKRKDCKLVTLGMIVDELGFSKYTEMFPGNQYEAYTLERMITKLEDQISSQKDKTVVIDAGIGTEENLKWLKEKEYKYIAVNRGKAPANMDYDDMEVIRLDKAKGIKIEVKRYEKDGEIYILCRSELKRRKEESMMGRVEQLFIDRLEYYKSGLEKKKRVKNYQKMMEQVGRLKERYPKAAQLYEVNVIPEEDKEKGHEKLKAVDIIWKKKEEKYEKARIREGSYILRTNRTDLSAGKIWELYVMLGRIEASFKDMKSHLGIRPVFHQKESRVDAHLFISVLAYHLMHAIEHKLRLNGDRRSWRTVRNILSTHERITIEFKTKEEDGTVMQNFLRVNSKLEGEHLEIYRKLGLSGVPLPRLKLQKPIGSDHTGTQLPP